MDQYLKETQILNFSASNIQKLIQERGWDKLTEKEKIASAYNFVKDEVKFGYNLSDDISASAVLDDGYGQCNTKSTLLMAFLRALGIPCRLHGFAIDKKLQKGAIYGIFYKLSPQEIIHSWVEVFYDNKWINLEGFIIDNAFLNKIQCMFPQTTGEFCGYGIATKNLKNPPVEWTGGDTYIQKEGIVKDFGLFNDPDEYYQKYHNLKGLKKFLFENIVRHFVNANVEKIRSAN